MICNDLILRLTFVEGPMAHDQPTYASVPGIRVFGMMCVKPSTFSAYRRPLLPQPPKRNQHFQIQSPYYQRYKKHATVKPTAQSGSDVSSQSSDLSEFTTRSLSTAGPETREGDDGMEMDESSDERTSTVEAIATTLFDNASPTTTIPTTDASIETTASDDTSNSRVKRMIDAMEIASDNFASDLDMDDDETDPFFISNTHQRQRRDTDDWPDIPWDEVSQQIQQIQWD